MKLSNHIPAIYPRLKKAFGISWDKGIIITYGEGVYCKHPLPDYKIAHEQVHVEQQLAIGADKWWNKYIADKEFRLAQEIEAYQVEFNFIKTHMAGSSERDEIIDRIYRALSSSIYGNIISYEEAKQIIK